MDPTIAGASSPRIISPEHREGRCAGLARRFAARIAALFVQEATQSEAVQRGCSAPRMPGEVCPRAAAGDPAAREKEVGVERAHGGARLEWGGATWLELAELGLGPGRERTERGRAPSRRSGRGARTPPPSRDRCDHRGGGRAGCGPGDRLAWSPPRAAPGAPLHGGPLRGWLCGHDLAEARHRGRPPGGSGRLARRTGGGRAGGRECAPGSRPPGVDSRRGGGSLWAHAPHSPRPYGEAVGAPPGRRVQERGLPRGPLRELDRHGGGAGAGPRRGAAASSPRTRRRSRGRLGRASAPSRRPGWPMRTAARPRRPLARRAWPPSPSSDGSWWRRWRSDWQTR